MYHSLKIGIEGQPLPFNTWDDWGLIPETRPLVVPPKVKTNYIDIPGANGSFDFTEFQSGIHYNNREGSWKFIASNDKTNNMTWAERYAQLLQFLHGKRCRVQLEDDPAYFYDGRLSISDWDSGPNWSTVTIDYNLGPYKNMVGSASTSDPENDWLWNDLFENIIYYGTFDVIDSKERTLINPTDDIINVKTTCSSEFVVQFDGQEITLPAGTTTGLLQIPHGLNEMTFVGSGRVIIDYRIEGLL